MATITANTGSALDWHTPSTWVGGVVPAVGDAVIIPGGAEVLVVQDPGFVNYEIQCDTLLIEAGGALVLNAFSISFPVTVFGSITLEGGGMLNTGTLTLEAGAVATRGPSFDTMEGVIHVKAGSTLTVDGGYFYAGLLRIAGQVTFSESGYIDFNWLAVVENGGVWDVNSGGNFYYSSAVIEWGGTANILGGSLSGVNFAVGGDLLLGSALSATLGTIAVHSGGHLTVDSGGTTCQLLVTYAGAIVTNKPNLIRFCEHDAPQVKSHDLPAVADVRQAVSYAGGALVGELGGGTVTITVE